MGIEIKKKTPKRLILNIAEEIHKRVRRAALIRNISLTKWVKQAIWSKLINEEQVNN